MKEEENSTHDIDNPYSNVGENYAVAVAMQCRRGDNAVPLRWQCNAAEVAMQCDGSGRTLLPKWENCATERAQAQLRHGLGTEPKNSIKHID